MGISEARGAIRPRLQHKVVHIQIANYLRKEEAAFDAYVFDFQEVVDLAASTIPKSDDPLDPEAFASVSFAKEFRAALYTTAIRCRNPFIRRRALDLLNNAPRREGFGDSRMVTIIAKKVIEMEEEVLEDLVDLTGMVVPSEWARVVDIMMADSAPGSDICVHSIQFR